MKALQEEGPRARAAGGGVLGGGMRHACVGSGGRRAGTPRVQGVCGQSQDMRRRV